MAERLEELFSSYEEAEKALRKCIDQLISELKKHIAENPADGVTPVAGGIRSVTVPVSRAWTNLSAEYWIPECQAEAVEKRLRNAVSPTGVIDAVRMMLESKTVTCSGSKLNLNEKTLEIIRESELGKFCR